MRERRVPFVAQQTETDCGAACVAMTLAYHGRRTRLAAVRALMGSSRDGTNARVVLEGARQLGLDGRAVRVDAGDVGRLPPGTILHWEHNHFVVLDRSSPDRVAIVDPASGSRRIDAAQLARAFTGVALLLEPRAELIARAEEPAAASPLGRYVRMLFERRRELVRVLVLSAVLQLLALALPLLTGLVVDRIVPHADGRLLQAVVVGLVGVVLFQLLTSVLRAHVLLYLRLQLDARLTLDFFDHLVQLPYAFFLQRSTGDLMMRLNSNATLREVLTNGAVSAVFDGTMVSLYLVILLLVSPKMLLVTLAFAICEVGIFVATRARSRALLTEHLEAQSRAENYEVQVLSGIESVKAAGMEARAAQRFSDLFLDTLVVQRARGRLDAWVTSLESTLRLAAPVLVLAYGTSLVVRGQLSLGAMLGLNALAAGFLVPLAGLISTAQQIQLLGSYVDRLDDVLAVAPEEQSGPTRASCTLAGGVQLDGVSFRYAPFAPDVLEDVSFRVAPGEMVALVGPSGSGKSTIVHLIGALFAPTRGTLRFDDVDLARLDLRALRRQLGVVTQQPALFARTIFENIAFADESIDEARVHEAARLAQIHDEIMALPLGYHTPLPNGGAALSGGQRQRIALARALVQRPRVLLLDEATSALDTETEARVAGALASLDCTRIVIAHRLSTIERADRIIVLGGGRIVDEGTHDELSRGSVAYRTLLRGSHAS